MEKEPAAPTTKFMNAKAVHRVIEEFARVPKKQVRVVLVDDRYDNMCGMLDVLLEWRNIFVAVIELSTVRYPDINHKIDDIVLLSEDLGEMTGTRIAEQLRMDGFPGVLASTAPGETCPPAFKHHFGHKLAISKSYKATAKFVMWLSELIEEVERDRMD